MVGAPSIRCHSSDITTGKFNSSPHLVRRIALAIPPTPAGTNTTAKIAPVAITRHFTHADTASPTIESSTIQIAAPTKMPSAKR